MKIVLASPNFPQPRGNTVTVRRIAANLEKLGIQTEIISTTGENAAALFPEANLVHGFHAYHFYQFLKKADTKPSIYAVTMTGTDLNQDLFHPDKRADVLASLNGAKAIHVFGEEAKNILVREEPVLEDKIFVIAQGNSEFSPETAPVMKEPGTFLFVLPAGVRKVKNIPSAISMLDHLHKKHPELRLWLVGPVLEEEEGNKVMDLAEKYKDWLSYIGQMPHEKMGSIYEQADVVLNTSLSEGQPAAILEAMGYGKAVIASDIKGNSSIISNGKTGYLFQNPSGFLDYAEKLMNNNQIKQNIGQSAKQYIEEHHSGIDEAKAFLNMYNSMLG